MTVGELMQPNPKSLSPNATTRQAAEFLSTHNVDAVFIVDMIGSVVGIITEPDLADQTDETLVSNYMQPGNNTVTRDTTSEQARHLMEARQIACLPVVEYGRLIGTISLADVAPNATELSSTQA